MRRLNQDLFKEIQAARIGSIAFDVLSKVMGGTVFGSTSRGVFLKTAGKWLIFLSFEKYHGPLTINLPHNDSFIPDIGEGEDFEISPSGLTFPQAGWRISLQEVEVWQPPGVDFLTTRAFHQARLMKLAEKISVVDKEAGIVALLPRLLGITGRQTAVSTNQPRLHEQIFRLRQQMNSSRSLPASSDVISLLGSGAGLTPSGDDFVLGMLLTFNRWRELFPKQSNVEVFNQEIVDAAYQKTTTLSANLIECASLGLGNERLIDTLDWIVSGNEDETIPAENLLSWGSSSGIDAFVGYVVAFSII